MIGKAFLFNALACLIIPSAGAEGKVFQIGEDVSWLNAAKAIVMEVHEGNKAHFALEVNLSIPSDSAAEYLHQGCCLNYL